MANTQIRTGNDKQTEIKHLYGCVVYYLTQRAQRTRSYNSLLFTLALEMSQVSLRRESAEVGCQTNILYTIGFRQPLRSLVARSQRPLQRQCCLTKSLRSLRPLRAEIKHLYGCVVYYLTQRAQRMQRFSIAFSTYVREVVSLRYDNPAANSQSAVCL